MDAGGDDRGGVAVPPHESWGSGGGSSGSLTGACLLGSGKGLIAPGGGGGGGDDPEKWKGSQAEFIVDMWLHVVYMHTYIHIGDSCPVNLLRSAAPIYMITYICVNSYSHIFEFCPEAGQHIGKVDLTGDEETDEEDTTLVDPWFVTFPPASSTHPKHKLRFDL